MVNTKQADHHELFGLEATQRRSACLHYWMLDSPDGPVSKGTCRSCGEERDFPNYIHDSTFTGRTVRAG